MPQALGFLRPCRGEKEKGLRFHGFRDGRCGLRSALPCRRASRGRNDEEPARLRFADSNTEDAGQVFTSREARASGSTPREAGRQDADKAPRLKKMGRISEVLA